MLRRSWPKFDIHELVRSTGQRSPRVSGDFFVFVVGLLVFGAAVRVVVFLLVLTSRLGFFFAQTTSVRPRSVQRVMVRVLS